ncbi:pseudouridine-5'-phosphate glycosidase [Leucothrix pacifica]|uniref:Pseudouridine-5'-phosphate glycosidase n=1 Tax=Leucothrix pacifica TaxID=1247513 RepID=A0A317CPL7_9GAMM|nr:pseudouridine-5'-phosphate glycosidase [Leucothrix pacifica]PWR00385.1 pseudouridine-5-phosphate glycosidase [Leucothrix pacifica]
MNPYVVISEEVKTALANHQPVVALESTIISHGMPYPQNVETALNVEQVVRDNGAVPATIAIIGGILKVGLSTDEIEYLGKKGLDVVKCSRRDLPVVVAKGLDGATTVATTMIIADMAGVKVFATGGIGGVHRGASETMDISADLMELAQTDVAVVCAGIKSILDIGLTLEYLETQGVTVLGYGTDKLPAFYLRDSGFGVDARVDSGKDVADMMKAKWAMQLRGGFVVGNPVPEAYEEDKAQITSAIEQALTELDEQGITGKDSTPFLLARVKDLTGGDSLDTNIQLVYNNAKVASAIAVAYCA